MGGNESCGGERKMKQKEEKEKLHDLSFPLIEMMRSSLSHLGCTPRCLSLPYPSLSLSFVVQGPSPPYWTTSPQPILFLLLECRATGGALHDLWTVCTFRSQALVVFLLFGLAFSTCWTVCFPTLVFPSPSPFAIPTTS